MSCWERSRRLISAKARDSLKAFSVVESFENWVCVAIGKFTFVLLSWVGRASCCLELAGNTCPLTMSGCLCTMRVLCLVLSLILLFMNPFGRFSFSLLPGRLRGLTVVHLASREYSCSRYPVYLLPAINFLRSQNTWPQTHDLADLDTFKLQAMQSFATICPCSRFWGWFAITFQFPRRLIWIVIALQFFYRW